MAPKKNIIDCMTAVKSAISESTEIPDDVLKQFGDFVDKAVTEASSLDPGTAKRTVYAKVLAALNEDKANRYRVFQAVEDQKAKVDRILETIGDDPTKAAKNLKKYITGTHELQEGIRATLLGRLDTALGEHGFSVLRDRNGQREVIGALAKLELGEDVSGLRASTVETAKAIRGVFSELRETLEANHIHVGQLDIYFGKQAHAPDALLKGGRTRNAITMRDRLTLSPKALRDKAFNAWKDFLETNDMIDWGRVLGETPDTPDARAKWYADKFDRVYSGIHDNADQPDYSDVDLAFGDADTFNLQTSIIKQHRSIHIKPDKWAAYNEEYGHGDYLNTLMQTVSGFSRVLALVQKFGVNPRKAVKSGVLPKLAENARSRGLLNYKESVGGMIERAMNVADGTVFGRSSNPLAAAVDNLVSLAYLQTLGSAPISQTLDILQAGRRGQLRTGTALYGMFKGMADELTGMFRNDPQSKAVLRRIGLTAEAINIDLANRYTGGTMGRGLMSKVTNKFFKITGQTQLTNAMRHSAALTVAADLAEASALPFDKLTPGIRRMLEERFITADQWDKIRSFRGKILDGDAKGTFAGDLDMILPDMIRETKDVSASEASALSFKLAELYRAEMDNISVAPGGEDILLLTGGINPKENPGAAAAFRLFTQLKSFPVSVFRRAVLNHWGAYQSGWTAAGSMGAFVASALIGGYIVNSIKDFLYFNRTPRMDFEDNWREIAVRGLSTAGGLGVLGDVMFPREGPTGRPQKLSSTLIGPAFTNTIDPLVSFAQTGVKAVTGGDVEVDKVQKDALDFAKSQVPNIWYTRYALNTLIFANLNELASPGYAGRMERRWKETNQERVIPFLP